MLPDRWKQFFLSKERAIFRFDPVPGTGKKQWLFKNFYKTACCCQERSLYGDSDHRKYGRGKRYPSNLPNAWDDRRQSRTYIKRSWKQAKKKKQWMKKGDNTMSYPTFTPLGAESTTDKAGEGVSSEKKKLNYNMSETKVKGEDYTRPGRNTSQTEDDDLRSDVVEEEYEVPDNRKSPERLSGKPGIRLYHNTHDSFVETGLPPEGIKVFEEDTPVAVDDSAKHGPKNKYRIGGDEGKIGPK